jgi:hypothetical protein
MKFIIRTILFKLIWPRHDIAEILLKLVLNTNQSINPINIDTIDRGFIGEWGLPSSIFNSSGLKGHASHCHHFLSSLSSVVLTFLISVFLLNQT